MTRELEVLQAGHGLTRALVEGLTPDDLSLPTPCRDWDVRALLVHVVAATDGLVAMLRDEPPDWGKDALGDDPPAAVRRSLEAALAAWSEPGAVDRRSQQMPGMRVVDFAMGDAVAHAWDLSSALGRAADLDPALVQVVLDRWGGEPAEEGRTWGAFGPRADVPADAPVLDRLLGELGRDPAFTAAPR
ncbi:MAG: hypothetical protein JWN08_633 [Frankiales bacterium]|nr:hypothetical protein [Frankiales bacterium]